MQHSNGLSGWGQPQYFFVPVEQVAPHPVTMIRRDTNTFLHVPANIVTTISLFVTAVLFFLGLTYEGIGTWFLSLFALSVVMGINLRRCWGKLKTQTGCKDCYGCFQESNFKTLIRDLPLYTLLCIMCIAMHAVCAAVTLGAEITEEPSTDPLGAEITDEPSRGGPLTSIAGGLCLVASFVMLIKSFESYQDINADGQYADC